MLLWRLSGKQHAKALDGGYGLHFDGRWNTVGHAVTYCATSPALCVLEKLVHVEDPALLPELVMVTYEIPDSMEMEDVRLRDVPADWRQHEAWSQQRGDTWHEARATLLLRVPSAIVPIEGSPDLNVLINHNHPAAADVTIIAEESFSFDPRLQPGGLRARAPARRSARGTRGMVGIHPSVGRAARLVRPWSKRLLRADGSGSSSWPQSRCRCRRRSGGLGHGKDTYAGP